MDKRWGRYKNDPGTEEEKDEHQRLYILDLVAAINKHNAQKPSETWKINDWYNRWIRTGNGRYFITEARLIIKGTKATRAFLGDTLVSRRQIRKDLCLKQLRDILDGLVIKDLPQNKSGFWKGISDTVIDWAEGLRADVKGKIELWGCPLDHTEIPTFLSKLVSWTHRLDKRKGLPGEYCQYENWLHYFLASHCNTKEFCSQNCGYASDGFYGKFRKPLCLRRHAIPA